MAEVCPQIFLHPFGRAQQLASPPQLTQIERRWKINSFTEHAGMDQLTGFALVNLVVTQP